MADIEHSLGAAHLPGCLNLSRSAHWNQNDADWRWMLEHGRGWGITLGDGTLAASTIVLPWGAFAWISMVLVLPEHRRQGYATRLLRVALGELKRRRLVPVLDATPAGRAVYLQEGFRDAWGYKRFALAQKTGDPPSPAAIRPLRDSDWPAILELDLRAFGASREGLLRSLAERLPQAARVAEANGRILGLLFGRDGREASQIGPLVARDENSAAALLDAALHGVGAPIYIDIADHAPALQALALARGFEFQRSFARMVRGAVAAPGDAALVACPAGAEFG